MSTTQTASSTKDSKNGADKKASAATATAASTDAKPAAAATPKEDKAAAPAAASTDAKTDAEGSADAETDAEKKERQKVYIVVGEVREFKNAGEAEKFLNKDPAAPKGDFTVIKGKKVEKKAKVSLR